VIHAAKVANYFRRGAEFGIAASDWKVEMPAVRDRKRKMVDGLVAVNVNAYRESGAELAGSDGYWGQGTGGSCVDFQVRVVGQARERGGKRGPRRARDGTRPHP